ncbi:MAG: STAS domain-containing protein, partial [Myxococcales bacterium]|nr:STAS domain-containing protein [Myxococcales bacterium]
GEFAEELIAIAPVEDEFGVTEQMFAEFARNYASASRELERTTEERAALIGRLQEAVKAMSTPIIDVADGVLTLPIIGVVDGARAADMTERLLDRVATSGARCVIIDVTGVDEIDDETARHLLRMVQGAELLGSYALLVGISSSVATHLVRSSAFESRGFTTFRSLKDGLRECYRYLEDGRR